MTAFEVDVDALREVVAAMGSCQRRLLEVAGDVEFLHGALRPDWAGVAADAHAASYHRWREECAAMITALAAVRGAASTADESYRRACAANVGLWEQVR